MSAFQLDDYVITDLARELSNPSAVLVYLYLWYMSRGFRLESAVCSHQGIAAQLGLSKSTVQKSLKLLNERSLIVSVQHKPSTTPEHKILWLKAAKPANAASVKVDILKSSISKKTTLSRTPKKSQGPDGRKPKKIDPRSKPFIEAIRRKEKVFTESLSAEQQHGWIEDYRKRFGHGKSGVDEQTVRRLAISQWYRLLPK